SPRRRPNERYVSSFHRQRSMAVPQHRSLSGTGIDEHHRELVGCARHRARPPAVDAGVREALSRNSSELIVAEGADVRHSPAEFRACAHGRRNLAAWQLGKLRELNFGVWRGVFRDNGKQVDAVQAQSGYVVGTRAGTGNLERNPHLISIFDLRLSFAYSA